MTTAEKTEQVRDELRSGPDGYSEEELRTMHRALDASLLIVLRAIAEITDR